MASGGSSSKSGKNLGSASPVNEDSSESETETEPAKSFHRRLSTNREIKCSVGLDQGRIPAETNVVFPTMETKIFQVTRTQTLLCQRYQGK
ncbi:hypothetical protein Trydic_g20143 [Trypoxylus dichotomus]